jgi:competence protein ComEC
MDKKILTRLPLFWISLAFIGGILLADQLMLPTSVWLVLAGAALILTIALRLLVPRYNLQPFKLAPSTQYLIIFSLVILFTGGIRYQVTVPEINVHHIAWYNDRQYDILVTGSISELPDYRDSYTNLRIHVEGVDIGDGEDLSVKGLLLARVDAGENYSYGEHIRLRGRLETPPEGEDFSYREYLARQGIHTYMTDAKATRLPEDRGNFLLKAIYHLKEQSLSLVYRIFPDPEASLLAGILLGVDTGMSADLDQAFKDTGTTHIIAISGFNIAILSGIFVSLFGRLMGPRRGMIIAIFIITLYTVLVGADAAVVRAAIMGTLSLFARQVGRRQDGLNTLAFTAAVMAVFNPQVPWDVGFQLSFGATLGLILYAQPLQQVAERMLTRRLPLVTAQKITAPIAEYILFTLAAQLTTLPIMAYHFKRISLTSLIANPFILPAQPPVMILGGLALLLGFVWLPLGQLVSYLAWPFTAYTIRVVELFARLPGGVLVMGDFSLLFVVLFYMMLFAATFTSDFMKRMRRGLTPAIILTLVGLLTIIVWQGVVALPDGRLHINFLDVGSADGILIQTPTGRQVLINGGPSPSVLSESLGRRVSPFQRQLDYLVVASTQEYQLAALPRILERYHASAVLWAGNPEASYASRQLTKTLTDTQIHVTYARQDDTLDLGNGASLRIANVNERGAVLLIEWGGFRAVLPVGMNYSALEMLAYGEKIGHVTALLLAESGYAPANPIDWIANLQPQVIVLSVAADDPFGLPDGETLDYVAGYTLLRTDRDGWIHLTTDGEAFWVEIEK